MDRWEFCYADMMLHRIYTFTPDGFKEEKIKKNKEVDGSRDDAFARAIARLGEEGWDMTNGVGDIRVVLFFKRRLL